MAHLKGLHSTLVLFVGSSKLDAPDVQQWSVKPNVTKINDGVCGEDRDRLDKVINFYDINLTMFNANVDKVLALLGYDLSTDLDAQPTVQFGIRVKAFGRKNGFSATEMVIDDWEWKAGGRADRQMVTIPTRTRYFKTLP